MKGQRKGFRLCADLNPGKLFGRVIFADNDKGSNFAQT